MSEAGCVQIRRSFLWTFQPAGSRRSRKGPGILGWLLIMRKVAAPVVDSPTTCRSG